ncbi:hypothetical protein BDF20DRAFT_905061 [Mycotypha africana]|uniref:uncharacterized protein n=1 Tax=Mycotypha africana TaxID=64632 RepID=UPI0023015141|nr:uncharacterized protein BDF20DRAFT_905061 [Mycotypha africana]KAI8988526.1 hypothetical protein BDF20DRAFT_905061 [Mycotypha africana]
MQRILPSVAPNPKERMELYKLCVSNTDDPRVWLTGWFYLADDPAKNPKFADIYRENVAEWFSWGFFASSMEDVLNDESATEDLITMLDDFENKYNVHFKDGFNENVVAYRLTLDPVHAYHRPLAFYTLVMFLTSLFGFYCQFVLKLTKYGPENRSNIWSLIEPQQIPAFHNRGRWSHCNQGRSADSSPENCQMKEDSPNKVPYWFRDGDRSLKPIVFIHGIGAGVMCYFFFLLKLLKTNAPIFFVELPYVSMQCTEDVPTMQETVCDLQNMLKRHHSKDAVFISVPTLYTSMLSVQLPKNTMVYLSEKDNIVESMRVNAYLSRNGVNTVVMKGLDHASFLFSSSWQNDMLSTIQRFISPGAGVDEDKKS